MRSKRFEALAKRPVNQDGFVKEWIEEGFIAMESPNDPKPSIKIVNGAVTELDGKPVSEFDLIDHFIARYGINLNRAEEVMAMDSVKLTGDYLHTSAIIVGDGQVLSAVNDVNDYAGPATGYRLQGERWEEIKNIPGALDPNEID